MLDATIERILETRVVAVIRLDDAARDVIAVAEALVAGGVEALEVTLTGRSGLAALQRLTAWAATAAGPPLVGAGSVRQLDQARASVGAGAAFLVSPGGVPGVLAQQSALGVPVMPGVLTPSEAMAAQDAGARLIKLFPASLGGPGYLRSLLAPLPDLRLVPTGGIALEAIPAYLASGAAAVGLGSSLVAPELVAEGRWEELRRRAAEAVRLARGGGSGCA